MSKRLDRTRCPWPTLPVADADSVGPKIRFVDADAGSIRHVKTLASPSTVASHLLFDLSVGGQPCCVVYRCSDW